MKIIVFAVILIGVFIARLNIPDNDISSSLSLKKEANVAEEIVSKLAFSNVVADWYITDLFVVKFACSERLKVSLIGMPFSKWKKWDENISSCE